MPKKKNVAGNVPGFVYQELPQEKQYAITDDIRNLRTPEALLQALKNPKSPVSINYFALLNILGATASAICIFEILCEIHLNKQYRTELAYQDYITDRNNLLRVEKFIQEYDERRVKDAKEKSDYYSSTQNALAALQYPQLNASQIVIVNQAINTVLMSPKISSGLNYISKEISQSLGLTEETVNNIIHTNMIKSLQIDLAPKPDVVQAQKALQEEHPEISQDDIKQKNAGMNFLNIIFDLANFSKKENDDTNGISRESNILFFTRLRKVRTVEAQIAQCVVIFMQCSDQAQDIVINQQKQPKLQDDQRIVEIPDDEIKPTPQPTVQDIDDDKKVEQQQKTTPNFRATVR